MVISGLWHDQWSSAWIPSILTFQGGAIRGIRNSCRGAGCRDPHILGRLWVGSEPTCGRLWADFGLTLDRLWVDLGGLWVDFWWTLGRLWADFGPTLGRLWADFGSTLGQLWVNFESILGRLCADSGPIPKPFRGDSELPTVNRQQNRRSHIFLDQESFKASFEDRCAISFERVAA